MSKADDTVLKVLRDAGSFIILQTWEVLCGQAQSHPSRVKGFVAKVQSREAGSVVVRLWVLPCPAVLEYSDIARKWCYQRFYHLFV